jgi:hypothetical protein
VRLRRLGALGLTSALAVGVAQGRVKSPPAAAPPATDIYLVSLSSGPGSMSASAPSPVSVAPGYDNQPMFSPDGGRILFAAANWRCSRFIAQVGRLLSAQETASV